MSGGILLDEASHKYSAYVTKTAVRLAMSAGVLIDSMRSMPCRDYGTKRSSNLENAVRTAVATHGDSLSLSEQQVPANPTELTETALRLAASRA